MKKLSNWIGVRSVGWVALLALVIFMAFTATILPAQAAKAEAYAGDVGSVDMRFFYGPDDVYEIAEAYGEHGRQAYVRARLTFDVIWPLVYTFFLATAISYVFLRAFSSDHWAQLLNLVPVGGLLFDYLENISISIVMSAYPTRLNWLASLTAVFTPIKWLLVNGSFVVLLAGLLVWAFKWIRRKVTT